MLRTGVALAEHHGFAADDVHHHKTAGLGQGGFDGIRQTPPHRIADDKAVDDDFHRMLAVFVQLDFLGQIIQAAVHPYTGKAGAAGRLQFLGLGALTSPDDRRQYLKPGAFREFHHLVHHLVHGLLADGAPADRTVRHADAGVHQTQIIVNFRHGPNSGTGVVAGGFLVNGNGRGKAGNFVHIRLFHLAQKLAGIAGQAFHIPALTVCIDGIKCQTGFAGAGQSCHDHQFVAGQRQVHVFQIVFSGSFDDDAVVGIDLDFICTQFLNFLLPLRFLSAARRSELSASVGSSPRSSRAISSRS